MWSVYFCEYCCSRAFDRVLFPKYSLGFSALLWIIMLIPWPLEIRRAIGDSPFGLVIGFFCLFGLIKLFIWFFPPGEQAKKLGFKEIIRDAAKYYDESSNTGMGNTKPSQYDDAEVDDNYWTYHVW